MKKILLILFLSVLTSTLLSQVPTPNIANGQSVCVNDVHYYGDQIIDPTATYQFSINPIQPFVASGQQIQVTWSTPGIYTITMTETNANGCELITTAVINVSDAVTATINPIEICEGEPVQNITGQNLGNNPVFSGIGVTGNTFDPAGLSAGVYNITVNSTSPNGCLITGIGIVTIYSTPTGVIYTD
jgi:hypothetical protein